MQGEFPMKKEEGDEKNSLMEAVKLEIELEKRKIREEIIASEIIQKRKELENEVRMELMMEKQMMGMRNFYRESSLIDPFTLMNSSSSSRLMGFEGGSYLHNNLMNVGSSEDGFRKKLKCLSHHSVDGVDDSVQMNMSDVVGDGEKLQLSNDVAMGKRPFERHPGLVVAAHVARKSVAELGGGEVLDQAMPMPSSGISGMKRKAETSEISVSDEEPAVVASKNMRNKWYCSLCDVSATSAGGLNLHLNGKKHKTKEANFKNGDTASSISTDSFLSENVMQTLEQSEMLVQPSEEEKNQELLSEEEKSQLQLGHLVEDKKSQVQPMEEEKSQVTKKWECSLCQIFATSEILLKSHLQGKKHRAKEAKLGIFQGTSDNCTEMTKAKGDTASKWHCSLCQVSAASEKNLNDHFQGKKHKAKAGLLNQEADNVDSKLAEEISDVKTVQGNRLEVKTGLMNEQEPRKSQVGEQEISNISNISNIVKFWLCKGCNEGTYDEATMAEHRKSSSHMDMLQKIGGGLIIVSNMPKEAVEGGKASQQATLLKETEAEN